MKIEPMIPIWLMAVISIALLIFKRKGVLPFIRQIIAVLLLFVINLRICVPDEDHVVKTPKIDAYVLFVLDDTISMLAEDGRDQSTRLDDAKEDIEHIVSRLDGARFGIMTFNNTCQIVSPFTSNKDHTLSMLDSVSPLNRFYAKGSSFNLCQEMIEEQMKTAKSKELSNAYVFFLSDGEANKNGEDSIDSYDEIADVIDGGAVLGYGSEKGGKMIVQSKDDYIGDNSQYIEDMSGQPAISKADFKNLEQISKEMDVEFVKMKDSKKIDPVIDDILENVKITEEEKTEMVYKETYYFLLPPLIAILIWDFIHYKRKVGNV